VFASGSERRQGGVRHDEEADEQRRWEDIKKGDMRKDKTAGEGKQVQNQKGGLMIRESAGILNTFKVSVASPSELLSLPDGKESSS
jgi:hypothetical protein